MVERQEKEPLVTFFGEGHFKTFYKKEEKIKLSQSEKGRDSKDYTERRAGRAQSITFVYTKRLKHFFILLNVSF